MFDWPSHPEAGLAVIGISNTHDLDSRVLPRIASRLSQSKLAFNPYNSTQLVSIINNRLDGSPLVHRMAIEFAARKVGGPPCFSMQQHHQCALFLIL